MAEHRKPSGYTYVPAPHANEETHRRIMDRLSKSSADQIAETAVRAGIYTRDGKLTEQYSSSRADSSCKKK